MFQYEQVKDDNLHWDEIPFIHSYEDTEDEFEEEDFKESDVELPSAEFNPIDVPEPIALLQKRTEVKEEVKEVVKNIPTMPLISPFDVPEPMGLLAMLASAAVARKMEEPEEDDLVLEDAWFEEEPKYEPTVAVVEEPKKKGWFSRLTDKVDRAMEKFGNFLDTAVPVASAAVLAATLGAFGTHLSDFNKVAQASETTPVPVQVAAVAKAVEVTPELLSEPVKLEGKKTSQVEKNQMLIEKNVKIVQNAGGEKAHYLHSETSHQHFITQLQKWGGYRAILEHPKVKEAKTTAQFINLVEQFFGERVADLVEANAAAMHQPA